MATNHNGELGSFDVYFDFQCPYANAAAVWLERVEEIRGQALNVNWRTFPLEQVNSPFGDEWKLWEQPDEYRSKGLPAFRAAIAARLQGEEAYRRFIYALFRMRHQDGQDLARSSTLRAAAEVAELDMERWESDRTDRAHLDTIAKDWADGREGRNVFGVPTFVFANGRSAYLKFKLGDVPEGEAALEFFDDFLKLARDNPNVIEIKRP